MESEASKRVRLAHAEIEEVMKRHDVAGVCALHCMTEQIKLDNGRWKVNGVGELFFILQPSYSKLQGVAPMFFIKKDEDVPDEKMAELCAGTVDMAQALSDMLTAGASTITQAATILTMLFDADVSTGVGMSEVTPEGPPPGTKLN